MDIMYRPETEADEISTALHPDRMSHRSHETHMREHPDSPPPVLPRAKSITVKLKMERRLQPAGTVETRVLEYPVPFALPGTTAYAGGILLTEDAERQIDTNGLAEILFEAYYQKDTSNLDEEMDEDDTATYMQNLAMAVMEDDDKRRREMLGNETLDAARNYAPQDRETTVRMRWNAERCDFDIKVQFDLGGHPNPAINGHLKTGHLG